LGSSPLLRFIGASKLIAAEPSYTPPAKRLSAAKQQGKIVLCTANFLCSSPCALASGISALT
jgi:hypothetical protein